mmetsp:Transcript_41453/g.125525  ORF Transcript_41453/g.125525 Transcript_41453/m.125525 type:complete len:215 (-) Transcript_41453:636-1280(-)
MYQRRQFDLEDVQILRGGGEFVSPPRSCEGRRRLSGSLEGLPGRRTGMTLGQFRHRPDEFVQHTLLRVEAGDVVPYRRGGRAEEGGDRQRVARPRDLGGTADVRKRIVPSPSSSSSPVLSTSLRRAVAVLRRIVPPLAAGGAAALARFFDAPRATPPPPIDPSDLILVPLLDESDPLQYVGDVVDAPLLNLQRRRGVIQVQKSRPRGRGRGVRQ